MATLLLAVTASARAEISLDMVTVGNAGNANDTTGYGAVGDVYAIGKYEVTNAQYSAFLNNKAAVGDPYKLYNTEMNSTFGGIARSGLGTSASPWVYSAKGGNANWDNRPVNYVSFWDAARFVNWLHNGQGNGDTESGAYLNVGDQVSFARQADAKYWIPTEDEWYKAAYHKNDGVTGNYFDYPTGSDSMPSHHLSPDLGNNANFYQDGYTIGSPYYTTEVGAFENSASPYGTFDQGGNVWEWNEAVVGNSSWRGVRGSSFVNGGNGMMASYFDHNGTTTNEENDSGFRVASVPEPGSITLMLCGAIAGLLWWKRWR
jgi:sulfatase modifying factor 1